MKSFLSSRAEVAEAPDVLREPEQHPADDISMTPVLLKFLPAPAGRIAGTLGRTQTVLLTPGLECWTE